MSRYRLFPAPVPGPGNGEVVGIDRGVVVSAALSTGDLLTVPGLTGPERTRLRRLERKLARALRGSNRRARVKLAIARLRVRETDRRTERILRSGWGLLVRRLENKAPGRVERISPAFTSQRCSACGHVDTNSRESQARFACTACGYASHADVNAACNIAAGHAVTARGGDGAARPVNREPQLLASLPGT
jgi:putative transposase